MRTGDDIEREEPDILDLHDTAKELGQRRAEELRGEGAQEILDEITNQSTSQEKW